MILTQHLLPTKSRPAVHRLLTTSAQFLNASDADIACVSTHSPFPSWRKGSSSIRVTTATPQLPRNTPVAVKEEISEKNPWRRLRAALREKVKPLPTKLDLGEKANTINGDEVLHPLQKALRRLNLKGTTLVNESFSNVIELYDELFSKLEKSTDLASCDRFINALSVLLMFCCRKQRPEFAQEILQKFLADLGTVNEDIRSRLLQPGPFRTLLTYYCSVDNKQAALEVIRTMRTTGIKPKLRDIEPLVFMCKVQDAAFALSVLESFHLEKPPLPVLNKVLSLCLESGEPLSQQAGSLYERILHLNRDIPPAETIGVFLDHTKNLRDMESIFEDSIRFNLLAHKSIQMSLLSCVKSLALKDHGTSNWFPIFYDFVLRLQNSATLRPSALLFILRAQLEAGEIEMASSFFKRNRKAFAYVPRLSILHSIARSKSLEKIKESNIVWELLSDITQTQSWRSCQTKELCAIIVLFGRMGDLTGLRYLAILAQESHAGSPIPVKLGVTEVNPPIRFSAQQEDYIRQQSRCDNRSILRAFVEAFASSVINEPVVSCDLLSTYGPTANLIEDDIYVILRAPGAPLRHIVRTAIKLGKMLSVDKVRIALAQSYQLASQTTNGEPKPAVDVEELSKALVADVNEVLAGDDILQQITILSSLTPSSKTKPSLNLTQ
ncbi:hypothetical protein BC829DRAFT_431685 [Chytridium lagenaria]|nr:hypothetical protein BC829DRAFT_431685 [Chytridium lagenaria]